MDPQLAVPGERMKRLIERIKTVGGIMSSADWAQTVVILIFMWLWAALSLASIGGATTVIVSGLPR
ncbi:MAG: hypothetical protein F4103_19480 [Boseongicola sp. SB0673_bin_14]|nr:hypothetical protein [Boseongicola sp. SB0667_bin_21]MYI70816.1 hypothetical protein [Boseongicola sp. SB0673_bin_14]